MKKILVLGLVLFNITLITAKEENFIVSKKVDTSFSKNNLKENIGQEAKAVLHQCSQLNKEIGKIQMEIADIQKNLFDKIEELIDNKPPFKRASRADLLNGLKVIQGANKEFTAQVSSLKNLQEKINQDKCLKKS